MFSIVSIEVWLRGFETTSRGTTASSRLTENVVPQAMAMAVLEAGHVVYEFQPSPLLSDCALELPDRSVEKVFALIPECYDRFDSLTWSGMKPGCFVFRCRSEYTTLFELASLEHDRV